MNDPVIKVVLQRCVAYEQSPIKDLIETAITGLGAVNFHGHTLLLKPNLISRAGPSLACTHPQFIAAVASWFLDNGAKVLLGDSPAFGSAARVCQKHGIFAALKGMDVAIVELVTPVQTRLAGGVTVDVASEALSCDFLVGLPKIKAHNQMYVTLGVKNIFGIVKGMNKAMLHMVHGSNHRHFAGIILDLLDILPPQLHLADGILAMHESGPLDGISLPFYCIAAARSPVAMDTALLSALELDARRSPLWQEAAARKIAGCDENLIQFPVLSPHHFHGSGFIAPENLNPIRFNPFRFLRGVLRRVLLKINS